MRYDELSLLTRNILEQAGVISDPMKVDLENLMIECDSENHFLNSILDYVEIVQDDPLEFLNNADYDSTTDLSMFKISINKLHSAVLHVLSVPLTMRNQAL